LPRATLARRLKPTGDLRRVGFSLWETAMRRTLLAPAVAVLLLGLGALRAEDKADSFLNSDLSGWEGLVKEHWKYEDGVLTGSTPKGLKSNTFLCSKKKYKDFELKFKVRLKGGQGNSGVQIRSKIDNEKTYAVAGPQCDVGAGYWGSLYGEKFGGMMKAAPKDAQKAVKPDDYNDYEIKCVGKKVTIKVNGVTTVDEEFAKLPEEGILAFQLHTPGPMEVNYKDVVFKELK
jgi:hypothetical protein